MTPAGGLFGRAAELALLEEAVRGTLDGTLRLVFLEGEGGIGKSTLLGRAITIAADSGFTVFLGEAEELEQGRPFRSMAEAMGCIGQQSDPRRAEIVRLLTAGSDSPQAFFRLIDAFDDLVESEALKGPIVLAIDDLQWADPGTVGTLGSISRRLSALPILLVGCFRTLPRSAELATLLRSTVPVATTLRLAPLDAGAVGDLARARVGGAPGPRLSECLTGAGGSPFYVTEILDSLTAESLIHVVGAEAEIEDISLRPSVVSTVLGRLTGLEDQTLEILRTAAVLGSTFRLEDAAAASGFPRDEVIRAVAELRGHGLLADSNEQLRFRHDLIREAIYEGLGAPVRVAMHRRAAATLSEMGAPASVVAPHLIRGASPGDVAAAETMIQAAGDPAIDMGTAARLLTAALQIAPDHPRRAEFRTRLARLSTWQGRAEEVIPQLMPLVAETSGAARAQIVLRLFSACVVAGRREEGLVWAKQASDLARDLAASESAQDVLTAAEALCGVGDCEEAFLLSQRALAMVAGTGSAVETEANNQCSWMSMLLLRPEESVVFSGNAVALPGQSYAKALHWRHHGWALADLDRMQEAESALTVAVNLAEAEGMVIVLHGLLVEWARLRYATGSWDEALVDVKTAAEVAGEFGGGDMGSADDVGAWIRFRRGAGDPEAEAQAPQGSLDSLLFAATRAFEAGELGVAAAHARELMEVGRNTLPQALGRFRFFEALPAIARACTAARDMETARRASDMAVELAREGQVPSMTLAALRCRSIVDEDSSAAREAADLARLSPRRVIAAEALEDAAAVLAAEEAVDALRQALDIYDELGALRDQRRVAARLADLDAPPPARQAKAPANVGWDALTAAELDVVRLAAEGLTNREIGSRLFISHRTVASHLSNVFGKLGLRSRVELAREAASHRPD